MEALGAQETGRSVINEMCGSLRANFQRRQEQQRPANAGEGGRAGLAGDQSLGCESFSMITPPLRPS